jgi:phosphoenolpyruvate phosphomutase
VTNVNKPKSRAAAFRALLRSSDLEFIIEAHNGLSAKIAEEEGFKGLWGSGLTISAAMGVRDNNEASWTQLLENIEFMTDATSIPLLLDGDTGYGNFNNVRRLVRKLCQRGVAAVCIEDKLFPKTNSFLGSGQPLADIDEFCGKIKAGKDSQTDENFSIVARVEALISGLGTKEALRRAEAYYEAGADAILIHSKKQDANEILEFLTEWDNRGPVAIVPTTYYATPTDTFRDANVSMVIWANHNLRASITAMRETSRIIFETQDLNDSEGRIATVQEIFSLQGSDELAEAESRYLPNKGTNIGSIILAASQGKDLGTLTQDKPKCMIDVRGRPLLDRLVSTLRSAGIREIAAVCGYRPDAVTVKDIAILDNPDFESTSEVASLACAEDRLNGETIVAYGDILFRRHILDDLLSSDADITMAVDSRGIRDSAHPGDLVRCSHPYKSDFLDETQSAEMVSMGSEAKDRVDGEWIGLMRLTKKGAEIVKTELVEMKGDGKISSARIADLIERLLEKKIPVGVIYVSGHWLDVDNMTDLAEARNLL